MCTDIKDISEILRMEHMKVTKTVRILIRRKTGINDLNARISFNVDTEVNIINNLSVRLREISMHTYPVVKTGRRSNITAVTK